MIKSQVLQIDDHVIQPRAHRYFDQSRPKMKGGEDSNATVLSLIFCLRIFAAFIGLQLSRSSSCKNSSENRLISCKVVNEPPTGEVFRNPNAV
jgi:hypothetical protein